MDENNSASSGLSMEGSTEASTYRLTDMETTEVSQETNQTVGPSQGSSGGSSQGSSGKGEVLYFDVQSEEIIMEGDEDADVLLAAATGAQEDGESSEQAGVPAVVEPSPLGEAASHYSILEGTSQRQKALLVDTRGYTYTQKKESKSTTYWRCSLRNKHLQCNASVSQKGKKFTVGSKRHVHAARPTDVVKFLLIGKMKQRARKDTSKMPTAIVREVLAEETGPCGFIPGLPTKDAMVRRVSRLQESMRPDTVLPLNFKLNAALLPAGFVRQDIRSRGLRHIMMATDVQLHHLMSAKQWYIDVILNHVAEPFTHLLCISCFAMKLQEVQLVPICFILMSAPKSKDYKAVFRAMLETVEEHRVAEVILDYDRALWKAFGEVFGKVERKGSLTHFKQSIRSKINQVGLGEAYEDRESGEHRLLTELLALPYLPSHLIHDTYQYLLPQAQDEKMAAVFEYVSDLWIEDELWTPQTWSVYNQSAVWFNNYAGWRQKIRQPSTTTFPFYRLVKFLYTQSKRFSAFVLSVSEKKMKKLQQSRYKGTQYHLGIWWKDYKEQKMNSTQLLEACAQLFADEPIDTIEVEAQEKD